MKAETPQSVAARIINRRAGRNDASLIGFAVVRELERTGLLSTPESVNELRVQVVDEMNKLRLLCTSQERRVLDAVRNWRPQPNSVGALMRLMEEASLLDKDLGDL